MLKDLLKHSGEYLKYTILTPFIVTLEVVIETMIPFVTASLIDNGVIKGDVAYIAMVGSVLVALAIMGGTFGAMSGWTASKGSTGFAKNLMDGMYSNIQDFSFTSIDKFSTSSLVTRLTTDVMNVRQSYQMSTRLSVRCPIQLTLALIVTFTVNWKIGLIFLVIAPILGGALFLMIRYAYPVFMKVFKSYDKMNKVVRENVKGVRVVKSFNSQGEEIEKFDDASNDIYSNFSAAERVLSLNGPLMMLCMNGTTLLIAWFSASMIIEKTMTTGELTMMIAYSMQILMSLMMFSMVLVMLTMSKASGERIVEVLREKSDIVNPEQPIFEVENGDIEFRNVGFSYSADVSKQCMRDVNFTIKSGEMVGILGGTGSGKTTLVQMLPRLYDATSGEVIIAGHNVRDYDIKTLRDNVSVVLQKNVLFSGTLRENMQWGNADVTDEEINEALELSSSLEFTNTFKEGYDHYIEQGGSNLSGGQKQRLCIARAMLKNPKILILDDSTSAVDTRTDRNIKNALKTSKAHVTKIIIAQRIASVIDADKIIVLDNGMINGIGNHDELMVNNTIYQEVYQSQNKGVAENE